MTSPSTFHRALAVHMIYCAPAHPLRQRAFFFLSDSSEFSMRQIILDSILGTIAAFAFFLAIFCLLLT